MLFEYQQQIQRFLRDQRQRQLNPEDLANYANRARREIAMRTQSIRVTPPTSGAIVAIRVTNPGSGYTNPTVVVSLPDYPNQSLPYPNGAQATALAIQIAGQIASVSVEFGGDGYQQPTATITDPTGSGVVLTVEVEPIWTTHAFQERYSLKDIPLDHFPGVKSAYAVREVALIYSNWRYGLPCYPWSTYQFFIRQYPRQYYYVPAVCTRFKPGALGDWFFYPIPSTIYAWDWDLVCLPSDLEDDQSVEALSEPWTDAVPFLGAAMAMEELQNPNMGRYYRALYDQYIKTYSQAAYLTAPVNAYSGGW